MKYFLVFIVWAVIAHSYAQTCTIASTASWSAVTCTETGLAPNSGDDIVIPVGITVTGVIIHTGDFEVNGTIDFDQNGSTITGNMVINGTVDMEKNSITINGNVDVFGALLVNGQTEVINGNLTIKSGGVLDITSKLELGSGSGCGYVFIAEAGSTLTIDTPSERLSICGVEIITGGGSCQTEFPGVPPGSGSPPAKPYCGTSLPSPPFGLDENGALPVELFYFTVIETEGHVNVEWATSSEDLFSHFEIERSSDQFEYQRIGSVDGRGGLDIITKYSLVDDDPIVGLSHYRLKAVDIDGSFQYFGPESIEFYGDQKLKVFPNPVVDSQITVELNFVPQKSLEILLVDSNGKSVLHSEMDASFKELRLPEGMSAGIYTLIVQNGTRQLVEKVVVK